jgi:hypothetical protein
MDRIIDLNSLTIIDVAPDNPSADTARKAFSKGITFLQSVFQKHKIHAYLILGPDFSISTNKIRIKNGFATGFFLIWDSPQEIVLLAQDPNYCGYTIAELKYPPDEIEARSNLNQLKEKGLKVHSYNVTLDLWKSNHFLSVFQRNDRFYAVCHCSISELSDFTLSDSLEKKYLIGNEAQTYLADLKERLELARLKRESIISNIFGDVLYYRDYPHLGIGKNFVFNGWTFAPNENEIPFMLGPQKEMIVYKPISTIQYLRQLGCDVDSLPEFVANILVSPHGVAKQIALNDSSKFSWSPLTSDIAKNMNLNNGEHYTFWRCFADSNSQIINNQKKHDI